VGHSIHYLLHVVEWESFRDFIQGVANGIGYRVDISGESLILYPDHQLVEPLIIPKIGSYSVKTNLIEPHHSIYLLILHSVAFFGSVSLWED